MAGSYVQIENEIVISSRKGAANWIWPHKISYFVLLFVEEKKKLRALTIR